jgi:hypothetical protein
MDIDMDINFGMIIEIMAAFIVVIAIICCYRIVLLFM